MKVCEFKSKRFGSMFKAENWTYQRLAQEIALCHHCSSAGSTCGFIPDH